MVVDWDDEEIKDGDADVIISSKPSSGMNFSNLSKQFGCDELGRGAGKVMGMASYGRVRFNVFNQYFLLDVSQVTAVQQTVARTIKPIDKMTSLDKNDFTLLNPTSKLFLGIAKVDIPNPTL